MGEMRRSVSGRNQPKAFKHPSPFTAGEHALPRESPGDPPARSTLDGHAHPASRALQSQNVSQTFYCGNPVQEGSSGSSEICRLAPCIMVPSRGCRATREQRSAVSTRMTCGDARDQERGAHRASGISMGGGLGVLPMLCTLRPSTFRASAIPTSAQRSSAAASSSLTKSQRCQTVGGAHVSGGIRLSSPRAGRTGRG